ncbi:MAG: hypothetical protein Q9219_000626 [cf. Caloplaca sp. 3 TL-2023]
MDDHCNVIQHPNVRKDSISETYVFLETTEKVAPNGKPAGTEVDPLPRGWEEAKNAEGQTFYIDHTTRTTTWTRPNPVVLQDKLTTVTEDKPLPEGWEQRRTSENRVYYVDHNTRTTSWVRPEVGNEETTRPLPPGWDRRRTEDGTARLYYVDHKHKTTHWTLPKPPAEQSVQSTDEHTLKVLRELDEQEHDKERY